MKVGTPNDKGLAEELLYERLLSSPGSDPAPSLLALKDGGLLTGFWYDGPDLEAASDDEVGRICAAVHHALEPFGHLGGWMTHFECIRRKAVSHIPSAANAAATDRSCDDERAERAQYYETHHALFVTFLEGREEIGFLGRVERFARGELGFADLAAGIDPSGQEVARDFVAVVHTFEARMEHLQRVLRGGGIAIRRMETREENCDILQVLLYICNGVWQQVRPPRAGAAIDVLLAQDLLVEPDGRGVAARHGSRAYQVVEPIRFPESSSANMLLTLEQLGVEWRRSTRAIFVGTQDSVAELEETEKKWDGLRHRLKDFGKILQRPRSSAVEAADEVGEALREIESGRKYGVHVTTVVVVTADSQAEAREAAREVERAFQLSGFVAQLQTKNNRQAYLGSFPGDGYRNVRRPWVDSLNLVHMLALSTEWEGESRIPSRLYPTDSPPLLQARSRSKARFFVNLHQAPRVAARADASRSEDTAHAAVFGPIGAGKSALSNALASQFLARYARGRVVYLDNGYSAYKLSRSRGNQGAHYAPGASGAQHQLHPFARIHEPRWMAFANDFVAGLAARHGTPYGEQERLVVADSLQRLRHGRRPEDRSLSRLWMDINEPRNLKALLEHFTLGGGQGVIDGLRDDLEAARFTCFELGELLNRDATVAQAALHYLLEWIRTVPDGAPTLLIIDEAGLALRDATIAKSVTETILRGRKENVHVTLLFHSPKQLLESPLASTVLPNIQTRFWLPNPEAANPAEQEGYRELGVREELLCLISTAQRKREYVYQSGAYARVFDLDLGPVQRAFWTYDGADDLAFVRALEAEFGQWWPREYLARAGLRDAAKRWEKLHDARSRSRGAA